MLTDTRRRMLLDQQIRCAEQMQLEPRITLYQTEVLDSLITMYRYDNFSSQGELEQLTQMRMREAERRYEDACTADREAQRAAILAADAKHVAAEEYSRWWRLAQTAKRGGNIDPFVKSEESCSSK